MNSKDKLVTLEDLKVVHDEVSRYTTCSTAASTAAKTAALTNFVLTTGSAVKVKFTNTNTASNPTLNVNSTGAKSIMQYGVTPAGITPPESWDDGAVVEFVYDGTNWVMQGRNIIDAVSKANGGTFGGYIHVDAQNGTPSTLGGSEVSIGNAIPTGTEGNSRGYLALYSPQTYWTALYSADTQTENRHIRLPDESGTLMTNQGGTFNGNVNIVKTNTGTGEAISKLTLGNDIDWGTVGNTYGALEIYSGHTQKVTLFAGNPTADRELTCPNVSGTINVTATITSSGGYDSATAITAVRNYADSLPDGACVNVILNSGNVGLLTILKVNSNYIAITRMSYETSKDSQAGVQSMQKFGGTWGGWVTISTSPKTLTVTRTNNTWFNAESIGRVKAYRTTGALILIGNLACTTAGNAASGLTEIASISGWSSLTDAYVQVPHQTSSSSSLLVQVTSNGKINVNTTIGNFVSGFYRFTLAMPINY